LLAAFNQNTKAVNGWLPNGCMAVQRHVRLGANGDARTKLTEDEREEKCLPAGQVPENDLGRVRLALGSSPDLLHTFFGDLDVLETACQSSFLHFSHGLLWTFLTRAVNTQLGLAVPGVSGKKKKARAATGNEMTPLMTGTRRVSKCTRTIKKELRNPTEEPSPSSKSSVAIQAFVDAGLQEATENRGNRDG